MIFVSQPVTGQFTRNAFCRIMKNFPATILWFQQNVAGVISGIKEI